MRWKGSFSLLPGIVAILVCAPWANLLEAQSESNIDSVERWAWSSNAGWINLRPAHGGVTVFADHLEGWAWGENVGWVRFGTVDQGFPHKYANASPETYGVNHDGGGNLSGYAWGSSIGWVNFAPNHGGVTVDLDTGRFDGYAWSENAGWLSFRNTGDVAYGPAVQRIFAWEVPVLGGLAFCIFLTLLASTGVLFLRRASL